MYALFFLDTNFFKPLLDFSVSCHSYAKIYIYIYIYIYAFSRRFYPKRLTVHSGYTYFCQYMCSLGIEPTTFALLTQCSNHWATGTLWFDFKNSIIAIKLFLVMILNIYLTSK